MDNDIAIYVSRKMSDIIIEYLGKNFPPNMAKDILGRLANNITALYQASINVCNEMENENV